MNKICPIWMTILYGHKDTLDINKIGFDESKKSESILLY